jgi:tetratricopeptide (TPR) repeat protein/predicted Ser/Thr protein kinase
LVPAPDEAQPDETKPFKVLSPGTVMSHYKIVEKIGEGGMGVVYRATDTKLDRTVALKFLPPRLLCDSEARERFEHEARAASALNHPNIATIFEIDEEDERCFISMEFLEGGSLKRLLKTRDLPAKEVLDLAIQIGEGLSAAHESGVTHRDMKPDNIMLTRKGRPKITDFGLAKLRGATKVTKTGTTLGTLQYMSPEQAGGEAVDSRSDIFSFGVILYEMVTGRLPFKGDNEAAIINSILNDTPEPLARYKADLPEGLQRIADRALTKDPEERYQHADDMVAELKHEKRLLETGASTVTRTRVLTPASRRRLLPILIPAVIAVVVILLILVFEPFRVEIGPGRGASAKENTLAIMYFENLAEQEDPEKLGEIITALLITDLSESKYINVVSSQRLYDILKLLGEEGTKVVDRNVASEVATEAGAKWMLLGSILRTVPEVVITTQLVSVENGTVEASHRITGEMDEDIFSLVDRLSIEIRGDLSLPAAALEEPDRPVAEVTTHSPEAYRHYVEALDYDSKYYFPEAQRSYERALEYDSTFAMAYYGLSRAQSFQGASGMESIAKAAKYYDNVSERERRYIAARFAYLSGNGAKAIEVFEAIIERYPEDKEALWTIGLVLQSQRRSQDAIVHFERVLELDPLHKLAHNQLAYCYHRLGDFDKAIWTVNKYISLAPEEANPYDTRGDLYAENGKLDLAIESYSKALEIKPDFTWPREKLGHVYLVKRDYEMAEATYSILSSGPDKLVRSAGRAGLAYIPMYQGKFEEALRILDHGLAADAMERVESWGSIDKLASKAEIYRAMKDLDSALKVWEDWMRVTGTLFPHRLAEGRGYYVLLLLESGQTRRAKEKARALKEDSEAKGETLMYGYWYAMGCIQLAEGDTEAGLSNLERAVPGTWLLLGPYTLAKAYLEADRLAEAVAGLEKVISTVDELSPFNGVRLVKAHYLLGNAYEKSGWNNKAIEQYEKFLDIWKEADPGIPEIEDARRRLARLQSGS